MMIQISMLTTQVRVPMTTNSERILGKIYVQHMDGHLLRNHRLRSPAKSHACPREREVELFLYDTAGQERFSELTSSYYRIADVCLLCFDLSNLATFDRTEWWMRKVEEFNPKCKFVRVGTKEDLIAGHEYIDMSSISNWAK